MSGIGSFFSDPDCGRPGRQRTPIPVLSQRMLPSSKFHDQKIFETFPEMPGLLREGEQHDIAGPGAGGLIRKLVDDDKVVPEDRGGHAVRRATPNPGTGRNRMPRRPGTSMYRMAASQEITIRAV